MRRIHRARLALVAAAITAMALVLFELPFSALVAQRSAIAVASGRLASVDRENVQLSADIAGLKKGATIAAMAHADYGLVRPGQLAYALLPERGASGSGTLSESAVPAGDLVPDTASPFGPIPVAVSTASHPGPAAGLWSRVLGRLAFWRGTF